MFLQARLWPVLDRLPIDWATFGRYGRRGWQFADKADSHLRYGPVWALVTPVKVYIHVTDADVAYDMFNRRKNFPSPKLAEIYGPCISTAHWTECEHHRKIVTSPFNENTMEFVWKGRSEQARQILNR
ncbi:hypothetical protein TSTA_019380 [Talaromyces stipitatus ATCC 10500]|uniref:Cytochrome P450 n=1 Tax=Talaromyces stipitatus (strain ATCC 10500 / CBS 375.48 / QM 6759 / NRRL 1006) TaxID=441959 RepID=B8MH61_TALSN|nr:uncharacterized protein TSTA_019380 [Talaromyces stipitatus ATCC 10500]EED16875.1 hypothetical protein TSTA_019380 [Talaromyces stipitatus ATCC 10500]